MIYVDYVSINKITVPYVKIHFIENYLHVSAWMDNMKVKLLNHVLNVIIIV